MVGIFDCGGVLGKYEIRLKERKVVNMEALNTYKTEKTLAEQMNERLAEMKMTKAEAALKMNYSRAALSQYLNGKYASDPTELEKKVREFLAATGGVAEGQEPENSVPTGAGKLKKKVEFFESRDFVQTIGVCQACQEYMGLGIIVGKSGQGKTHALKKYAELPRVAYIECDDTMACRDLVEAIENGIGVLKFKDMDEASVELGYEDDFDSLIDGYVRCGDTDYWKEIMIKDDMMKLDRVTIKASFVDCEPQDVIRYVLACAGIEDYVLSDEHYGKKDLFVIDRKSGINTIAEVNSSWGIKNPFFFQKKVFYWGTKEEQKEIYVLEEGETILSLNKYGDLWEAETIAIPWIHHSQEVEVQHSKYSGIVTVEKTIVRSDDTGAVHMYIYFAGGEKDV